MSKYTEEQRDNWKRYQRKIYKEGLLSPSRIKKLESLPGWCWEIDRKGEAITVAREALSRAKERNRLPKQGSKDPQEEKDADWFSDKKQAKLGKGKGKAWYPILNDIAKEYGFEGAFDTFDRGQRATSMAHEVFEISKKRGRLPSCRSEDPQEARHSRWIFTNKQSKRGKRNGHVWRPVLDNIAKEYGFKGAFDTLDREVEAAAMARVIFSKAKKNNKLPRRRSGDLQEEKGSAWISSKRQAKRGKGNGNWYPQLDNIAKEYGFPETFDITKKGDTNEQETKKRSSKEGSKNS